MRAPSSPLSPELSAARSTVRLAWRHLAFAIPATWEVIGYKTNPADGQIVLADRHGETMRVFWKTMKEKPDVVRRMAAVIAEETGSKIAESETRARLAEVGGWQSCLKSIGQLNGLAGRYEESTQALLYVVFPQHPDTEDRSTMAGVLESFQPNDGEDRVWAAFGLDITLPKDLEPADVEPFPAAQVMCFENRRGESVTVRRYGMLPLILADADPAVFFARAKGPRYRLYQTGTFVKDGRHPGIVLSYTTRGKGGIEGFVARTWQGRIWVWQCEDLKRLYGVDQNALEKHLIPDLPDRVRCL